MTVFRRLQIVIRRAHDVYHNQGLTSLIRKAPTGVKILLTGSFYGSIEQTYANRSKESLRGGNYTKVSNTSVLLAELLDSYGVAGDAAILEIGCNAGRNLAYLQNSGFTDLHGIEINPEAIELMEEAFSSLRQHADIHVGRVQDVIEDFDDNRFDVVYTMAVLQHIDRGTESLFPEIARVTGNLLILVEAEGNYMNSDDSFILRDYGEIFAREGMEQLDIVVEGTPEAEQFLSEYHGDMAEHENYTLRVFQSSNN